MVRAQDLYNIYNWGGYKYTNYAKEPYERYVSTQLEGLANTIFGNWVTRGWRIYEWRQQQPWPGAPYSKMLGFQLVSKLSRCFRCQGAVFHLVDYWRRYPHDADTSV